MEFGPETLRKPEQSLQREWLETNGIGGFASSTIWGMNTRRYHGLLIAAAKPPVGRMVLLSKLDEIILADGRAFELGTNRYPGVLHPRGFEHLTNFRLDPLPTFRFEAGGAVVEKTVFMAHGENTTVVRYKLLSDLECTLEIYPLVAFRDYHNLTHRNHVLRSEFVSSEGCLEFRPYDGVPTLYLAHESEGVEKRGVWYSNFEYDAERDRGLEFTEDLFNPFVIRFGLTPGQTKSLVASTEKRGAGQACEMERSELRRRRQIEDRTPVRSFLAKRLVRAADQYLVDRNDGKTIIAGYHWFGDWGRDTMIALPGITLTTGRYDAARAILGEFAKHVNQGMLPNRFPDAGELPEYNTVDATLWFFEAAHAYWAHTQDNDFVLRVLYPKLLEIIDWHRAGARFGIRVDSDGLLHAGEAGTQLTWMDARIGDWVVTPRCGKPVEVQALWYNALRVLQRFAQVAGDSAANGLEDMADRARTSFNRLFWNEELQCLYDVIDGDLRDASIRPNQVLAISLTHSMLNPDRARRILRVVESQLLTPLGLRTLAPSDPSYAPHYAGNAMSRDSAYHQGTVWPWLIGPFIRAYMRTYRVTDEVRDKAKQWVSYFEEHLRRGGLGHISEVADAVSPHRPGGCIAQAWSVGELLRVLVEDLGEADDYPKSTPT